MLKKLKLKIGLSKLRKLQKGLKRTKRVYNLVTARKIGIISCAESSFDFEIARKLVKILNDKNLEVCLFVYYPDKDIPQNFLTRNDTNVISIKDLNWYGRPISPLANSFQTMEFDILIDLSMVEVFPIRWICTLSSARFKVGCLSYIGNPNDLLINIKPDSDVDYYIRQLLHYLTLINNRFAQEEELINEET